ncbi:MAG TPA: hypothetical protein V6D14_14095 [Coleofasciculaceae cyanobacterium]
MLFELLAKGYSTACRIIRKVEKILSEARVFTLPGSGEPISNFYDSRLAIAFVRPYTTPVTTFPRCLLISADRFATAEAEVLKTWHLACGCHNMAVGRKSKHR